MTADLAPLRRFVAKFAAALDSSADEAAHLRVGGALLAELLRSDDWLPDAYAAPHPDRYGQYLLHCDSLSRFSVVSFAWAPGQSTPIHDHTVWGLIGVLRGAELAQAYVRQGGRLSPHGPVRRLERGEVEAVSPTLGDIHQVSNALSDQVSVSIHVYGANIGAVRRTAYEPDGRSKTFISGYANTVLPNIWDASKSPSP